ncbi:hypothetical protein BO78DRAFT_471289 [Aspergillus sclerotiicarbonarius CBS 121057]|uniref:Uncharacterized protein n=1 Tax=Aspergillus sclerotiicarbonarius (strain CBS 121057 / IBT 28362) TaxID=1448318 RepID=A0A319E2W5_ASPSB|nr:hypothetical protein BO78DRAFT_471289 [Aspergillus sclerotiicarbonarius CBS 121057]
MSHTPSQSPPDQSPWTLDQLFLQVRNDILSSDGSRVLTYTGVEGDTSLRVACMLSEDETISPIHVKVTPNSITKECQIRIFSWEYAIIASWAGDEYCLATYDNFFTCPCDSSLMSCHIGDGIFPPPFQNAVKQPGFCFIPKSETIPTVICEVGWSEDYPRLLQDKDLWFTAGVGHVNVVILLNWSVVENRVSGFIEIWRQNGADPERFQIFPSPSPEASEAPFVLYRGDLYRGGVVPEGRSPDDAWDLELEYLRVRAQDRLRIRGLVPA